MKTIEMLVYGKSPEILQTVIRLINTNEAWNGEGVAEEKEVIEKCRAKSYDLVLLGGGVSQTSEDYVRAKLGELFPGLKVVQHFGGGSGLLASEIQITLADDESNIFNVEDNSVTD